jgi:hypothetical protein
MVITLPGGRQCTDRCVIGAQGPRMEEEGDVEGAADLEDQGVEEDETVR